VEWSAAGGITTRCYWDLPKIGEGPKITFEEALEETEKRIIDCTRLRLVADVPIAALLSGGIDSALVCWAPVAAECQRANLHHERARRPFR